MAKINLLPWREELREQRKNQFLQQLGLIVALGAAIIFASGMYLDSGVEYQKDRNRYIEKEIAVLDERIREIRDLRSKREQLLSRMRVIQELQGNRPVIVRVFDELVRTLVPGVFYQSIAMEGSGLSLVGTAESNQRVASQMRSFDESDWFTDPNLRGIRKKPSFGPQASDFQLSVKQIKPNESDAAGEG